MKFILESISYWTHCMEFALIGQLFQINIAVCLLFARIVLWVLFKICPFAHNLFCFA